MTNAIRKLLSFLLVAVMMLSLAAPLLPVNVFAASAETVQSASGDDLTVGVLSDIHISDHFGEGVQLNRLKKALLFLKSQDVDAIIIAGDLQEYSDAGQLETSKLYMGQIVDAWQEIFPAAKGEAGYVEPILIYGNHDTNMTEAGWWPEEFGTFSAAYTKTVNGYTFVAANHHRTPQTAGPAAAAPLLESAVKESADKPVFYIQHSWIGDTVPGWGYGDGEAAYARTMLAPYHNVVAFTGHTHVPLTDEKSIWQGDGGNDGQFTVINAATTNYSGLGDQELSINSYAGNAQQTEHGMVMHVNGSQVSVERYSFNDMAISGSTLSGDAVKIGETWSWDACDATDRPYAYDTRYETANAPAFASGATLTAGSVTDNAATVTIPAAALQAPSGYSDMIAYYIVEACDPTTGEVEAYKKLATSHHIDDKSDVYQDSYTVTVSGLQPGVNYTLKAYAVEFFGKRSEPLSLNVTTTGTRTYYRVGDVNQDGNIDSADMTALKAVQPSDYNALADVDGNGVNDSRDVTALQAKLDATVITYPESDDLFDRVSKVTLTNVGTSSSYQPVAYGTGVDTGVVNGNSNQSVKTWTTNRIGWANTTIYFDEPVDLSGYTHLTFDTLFENEYNLSDSYLKRYLAVSLISGHQEQRASVGSLNFDQNCTGWDTKTISLAGLKNIDLTAVTGIRFGHNFEYYEGRFDGVTEHAIYWDNLYGLVLEGADADMLASSTVTGGKSIFGAGYTNNTNTAIYSTGGTLDVVWASEKVINDYAAFAVDMRTPVKTTVQVQPIDASGNLLGSSVAVESCNIYQNKEIATAGFGLADDAVAAGLRFTYSCDSLLLDNMNARGAKDFDLIGTASRVEAIGGDKLTMVVTTEGTNSSNNAVYAYAMPYTSVWGGGAKLVFDEGLDLSRNHYLRYDIKIVNNHRDLYLKLYDTAGELIADYGTLRIHQSIGDGTGAYVTYEIDLLNGGAVTPEQLKNIGAIQLTFNMHSDSNYDSNGSVNNNAYNDPNAPRQIWIDNVYAVNPLEDFFGAATSLTTPTHVQDGFVCEILPTAEDRTNVLHWQADSTNNSGTTSNWPGSTYVSITKDLVKHNSSGAVSYDYLEFDIKTTGMYIAMYLTVYDASGNKLGSTGEYRISYEQEWSTYRVDASALGMSASDLNKIAKVEIGWNWRHQNVNETVDQYPCNIYIDNMGLRTVSAESTDRLDQLSLVMNSDWWTGGNGKFTGGGWLFQSEVTSGSDKALMFYRSETSQNISYPNKTLYMYFLEPITLASGDVISLDALKHNYNATGAKVQLIGSDNVMYDLFSFTHTEAEVHNYSISVDDITGFNPATTTVKGLYFGYPMNPDSSMDKTADGYLVLDNLFMGDPNQAPEEPEDPITDQDFLYNATISNGVKQSEVTNSSEIAWRINPSSNGWSYPVFNLDQTYDISSHTLVMDIKPVNMEGFRMHLATINGQWPSGDAVYYTNNEWTTVTFDLSANSLGITEMTSFGLGICFNSDVADAALYIDNVRLIDRNAPADPEADEDFLFNAIISNGELQSETTNNSQIAWKITPSQTGWSYPTYNLGTDYDISNHQLVMDIYPANMTSFRMHLAQINGSWIDGAAVYYTPNTWTTVTFDLAANSKGITAMNAFSLGIDCASESSDYALYIDNVRLVEKKANAGATEETELASDMLGGARYEWSATDWTGAGAYSYSNQSQETNGADSLRSWSFSRKASEGAGYSRLQIHLQKTYDMSDKDLVFDIKFENNVEIAAYKFGIIPYDASWANVVPNDNYLEPQIVAKAGDWYTVRLDNSVLKAHLLEGKDLSAIMLLGFCFQMPAEATTVYIDNMHLEDHIYGTAETDAASDLLVNAEVIQSAADDSVFFYEHSNTSVAYGENSNASHKFYATAEGAGTHYVKFDLGQSYDLTDKDILMDVFAFRCDTSFAVHLYNSHNARITSFNRSCASRMWSEVSVILHEDGVDLSDIRYIRIDTTFQSGSSLTDRAFYVDNLRIVDIDTYDTALEGKNIVFIGDSITASVGYKGWSGQLQNHYGINRYNIGVGGTSYATISGRDQIYSQRNNIPSNVNVDMFILNGGVNDIWSAWDLGAVSSVSVAEATVDSFDTNTTAGGMEQMFCYLRTNYPNAQIGFIITYNCYDSFFDAARYADEFVPLAKAICDKWGVPYLDLVNNDDFNAEFNALPGVHTYDGVHANDVGYELVMRQVAPWLLTFKNATAQTEQNSDMLSQATYEWSASDWSGAGHLSYDTKSTVTNGADSLYSWKFSATAAASDWPAMQIKLSTLHKASLTGKALQFDVKFEADGGTPVQKLGVRFYDGSWASLNTDYTWKTVEGEGWQTVTIPASEFEAVLTEGKTLDEIYLIQFMFDFADNAGHAQDVYIDNLRIVDVDGIATVQTEAASDLLYGAAYVSGTFTNAGFGIDQTNTMFVNGSQSKYSLRMYSSDTATAWCNARFELSEVLDLTGKTLKFDVNQYNHVYIGIKLYNSNNELVTTDEFTLRATGWQTFEVNLLGGLAEGMTAEALADIKYVNFSSSFEYAKANRILVVDNLQTYENDQYDTALNGLNGLYLGDSISEAISYKGWAGELAEHYGVNSYNVSKSGATLSDTTTNVIQSQLANAPADVDYDFVMLNGGVNDVWQGKTLGTVSPAGTTEFDTTTAIGALEHLFASIKAAYPDAEIFYILNYVCVQAGYPSDTFRNEFAPLAREACQKWGVHCLDLVDNAQFNAEFDATANVHTYDGVHANTQGYVVLTKYIAPWLESVFDVVANSLTDMIANSTAFKGPTAVQENFRSGILDTTEDGRTNVAYASAVTDNGLTNSNWPGELKITFPVAAADVDTTVYDFLEFDYKNTGVKYALYVTICDADGNKLGTSGEIRATNVCDWTTHRIDLTTMGLTAEELKLAAQIWFSVSWEYNNSTGSKLQAGAIYFDNARFGSVIDGSDNLLDRIVRTKINNGTANTSYTNAGAYFDAEGGYVLKRGAGSSGWYTQQLYFDAPITVAAGASISADFLNTGFHHGYSVSLIGSDGKTYSSIAPNADGNQSKSVAIESFASSGVAFDPAAVTIMGIHISYSYGTCHSNPDDYATLTIQNLTILPPPPNPLEDMIANHTSLTTPTAVQEAFVCEVLEETEDGHTDVIHWYADPNNNGGTTSNWPGTTKVYFDAAPSYVDTAEYDYLEFKYKHTNVKYWFSLSVYDAAGNKIGVSTGKAHSGYTEWRTGNETGWATHRIDLDTLGLTAEELKTVTMIEISVSWEYNNASGTTLLAGEMWMDDLRFGCIDDASGDMLDKIVETDIYSGNGATAKFIESDWYWNEDGQFVITRGPNSTDWRDIRLYFDEAITVESDWTVSLDFVISNFHHGAGISLIGSDGLLYTNSLSLNKAGSGTVTKDLSGFVSGSTAFDPATVQIVGIRISYSLGTSSAVTDPTQTGYMSLDNLIFTDPNA